LPPLNGSQSKSLLKDWSADAQSRVWLCSAYIKLFSLQEILTQSGTSNVSIIARWNLGDLVQGSSDVEAAEWAISLGYEFWVSPRLHAKACLMDNHAWLGSSNVSRRGMPESSFEGNIELGIEVPQAESMERFFRELFGQSVKLSGQNIQDIKKEVSDYQKANNIISEQSTIIPKTIERIIEEAKERKFFSFDLPWCQSPSDLIFGASTNENVKHDLELLSLVNEPSLAEIRTKFEQTRIFDWLKTSCKEEQRFGFLTKSLHDLLHDEPKPYRKDVKRLLSNLLQWVEELFPDKFHVYVPGQKSTVVQYLAEP